MNMDAIVRQRETETRIGLMDTHEIADEIHALQDECGSLGEEFGKATDISEKLFKALEAIVDDLLNNDGLDAYLMAKHAGAAALDNARGKS